MKRILRISIMTVIFIVLVSSLIPVDRETVVIDEEVSFKNYNNGNEEMYNLVKTACYDCHSYETVFPWYSRISPGKFIVQDHVEDGRSEFNFSEWGTMSLKDRNHILEECAEEVKEKEMPLKGYTLFHSDANLSVQQREKLAGYFLSLMK